MKTIERLQKLSGIIVTEAHAYGEKKYAEHDKSGLQAVKKELQGILATAARSSFKYKNAQEEMKVIEACLRKLEDADKKEVKESIDPDMRAGMELNGGNLDDIEAVVTRLAHGNPVFESKKSEDDSDKDDNKSEKKDDDSDKKDDDDSDEDDKKSKKSKKDDEDESEEEDDDKKSKKSKKDDEDESEEESEEEDDDDDDEEEEHKICEAATPKHMTDAEKKKREDIVRGMKKNKAELKKKYGSRWKEVMYATATQNAMESVEKESIASVVARILEKDLTPTKVEVDYENGPTDNSGIKLEQGTKIRLPASIKAEVKQRIKELNQAILRYDDSGYDDKSIKQQAVDCLNQILQNLSTNDLEGVKKAQIYFETLMSPLTDFFPPKLINWLANAVNPYVGDDESA